MEHTLCREKSRATEAFFYTLLMAVLLFLPFIIYNRGLFIYYGDFNAQQIPFYKLAHQAVREGNLGWSWTTDLGANFVGSYSFYLLGSPFFWLTLPFPTAWVPYLMAPLLMLKMACAGLAAYGYLARFLRPKNALIGAVLYAFSGFSLYNIFFNHFHEAMIWFPLLLLGLERYMAEGKRGLFALAVMLTALNNYYFFIAQALFVMIYWVVRATAREWPHPARRFFGLWLEALLGTAGAAVLLLPSYLAVIQNGRTDNLLEGWEFLIYSTEQRPLDILHSFFFPPDLPARPAFFPDSNNKWSSLSAWLPVFGATGAIAYFQSRHHKDWLRRLLVLLVIFAFVPGLNAFFQLFNQIYYARWYYMPVLFMILATLRCFDDVQPVEWGRALGWSGGITAAMALTVGLLPESWDPKEGEDFTLGLAANPARFWAYVVIAVACLLLTWGLARYHKLAPRRFGAAALATVMGVSLLFGWGYITMAKYHSNYPDDYVIDKLVKGGEFDLPEDGFARTDMFKGMDNQGMYWDMPCIQAFHSIVPGSVMDFYETVGVSRSVGSRPETDHYALRSLLSVRWLFDYNPDAQDVQLPRKKEYFTDDEGATAMPGWVYYDNREGYDIYENENYIPMGFAYDFYVTREDFDELTDEEKQLVMLAAVVVEEGDSTAGLERLDVGWLTFTREEYAENCAMRQYMAADSFAVDTKGFTATVKAEKDTLLFFSVPYEEGWTATVDGVPATVQKVNVGFMAVTVPGGRQVTVRFDYETPGLRYGLYITAGGVLLFILYLLWPRRKRSVLSAVAQPVLPPPATRADDGFDLYSLYQPDKNTQTNKETPS